MSLNLEDVLVKPVLSEKATKLTDKYNRYTFLVRKDANKFQIKAAVERLYKVKVLNVVTSIACGNTFRNSKGLPIKRSSVKKAMVKLAKDNAITFYQGV